MGAPIITAPSNYALTVGSSVNFASLFQVSDPDGNSIAYYLISDGNGASDSARAYTPLFGGQYSQQGATYRVDGSLSLSSFYIVAGSAPTTDYVTFTAVDSTGQASSVGVFIVSRAPNRAPVVTSTGAGPLINTPISAASLVNVVDPDGDATVSYQFWDDAASGGYFVLNGVVQGAKKNIDVSAAQLGNLTYVGAGASASETLYARAYDGTSWGEWAKWDQRTLHATNTATVLSAPNKTIGLNQWLKASDLGLVFNDADGDTPTMYEFSDGNAADNSARFYMQGGGYAMQGVYNARLAAEQWANYWIQGGSQNSMDTITVRVYDGYEWSNSVTFNLGSRGANQVPVVLGGYQTVVVNQSVSASSLIQASDPDGDSIVSYRFVDTAGGGYFKLGNVVQAAGQNIDVTAAQLGDLTYVGGSVKGSELLTVKVFDGQSWSTVDRWAQSTIRLTNTAPVLSAGTKSASVGTWIKLSDLGVNISDADGDAPSQIEITDGNGAASSARIWFSGQYYPQGVNALNFVPEQWAGGWIQAGSTPGTDALTIRVYDGMDWSNTVTFNLVTRAANRAPVVGGNSTGVAIGQSAAATSLINVTDADGDTITAYRFWDSAGGGYFKLGSSVQASSQNIEVTAAQIGDLSYVGGSAKGSETLYAQVFDGEAWSAWGSWTQNTIRTVNTLSAVSAANRNTSQSAWIKGSDLGVNITDADGDTPTLYEISDANTGTSSARFWLAGNYTQGGTMTLTAEQWAGFWIQGGTDTSTDALTIRVNDGYGWSNTASFNLVTRLPNRAPVVAGSNTGVAIGQSATAASLINVTDADGDTITAYRFWDSAGGGYFKLGSTVQASSQNIEVTAAQVSSLVYVGAGVKSSETLYAQVFDGQEWSAWGDWSQQTVRTSNAAPVVNAPNRIATPGQWLRGTELGLSVSDADGDAVVEYVFTDGNGGASSARLWYAGSYVAQGGSVTVSAGQLAQLYIQGGSDTGTDAITVKASDGAAWSNPASFNVVTRLPNRAPVVSAGAQSVYTFESKPVAAWFSVTDADGDAPVSYKIYDDGVGGGYFTLNGVQQAAKAYFTVAAADLALLEYYGGEDSGTTENIYISAYDGQAWSAEVKFAVTSYLALTDFIEEAGTYGPDIFTGSNLTVQYGTQGQDIFSVTEGPGFEYLVGGRDSDTYNVPFDAYYAITLLDNSDSVDLLEFDDFLSEYRPDDFGIATLDNNRHLVLVDYGTARMVIALDWEGYREGYVGGTFNYSTADRVFTTSDFQAAFGYYGHADYTWEELLGIKTSDINGKIAEFRARNAELEVAAARTEALAIFKAASAAPRPYPTFAITRGNDDINDSYLHNQFYYQNNIAVLGGPGNDSFQPINQDQGWKNFVEIGGSGGDTYRTVYHARTIVIENGNTAGDTLWISTDAKYLAENAAIIDGRHLIIRTPTSNNNGSTMLIMDWQRAENRIETFTNSGESLTYDQFAARIASANLQNFSWEALGSSTAAWNLAIDQYYALSSGYETNTPAVVVSNNLTLTRSGQAVSLSTLFNVVDSDAPGPVKYRVTGWDGTRGTLWSPISGNVTLQASFYLNGVDAATLNTFQVTAAFTEGSGNLFQLSVYDGYDWSVMAPVSVTIAPDPGGTGGTGGTGGNAGTGAFGPSVTTNPLGSIGTVSTSVVLPKGEGTRLDSIVHVNPGANVSYYEFIAVGANTGWTQGAYLQSGSTILTSLPTIDAVVQNLSSTYLESRTHTTDTEAWRVRAYVDNTWTDWVDFSVATVEFNAANMPVDSAPSSGRAITVGATTTNYNDYVSRADRDVYTFTVASSGTLTLDFSGMYDYVRFGLSSGSGTILPTSANGVSTNVDVYNQGANYRWMGSSGGSATYALAAGDYTLALDPMSGGSTPYQLGITYQ